MSEFTFKDVLDSVSALTRRVSLVQAEDIIKSIFGTVDGTLIEQVHQERWALFIQFVRGMEPRIPSLPADATEQAEIDSYRTQPAHVSHVEPERAKSFHVADPQRQREIASAEKKRAPLDWNKSTPFDAFPGYEVFSDAVSSGFMPAQPKAPLHPLQRVNEGGNALHGSAALLQDLKVR